MKSLRTRGLFLSLLGLALLLLTLPTRAAPPSGSPGKSGDAPGQTGSTPGQSGSPPPGLSGSTPGQSESTSAASQKTEVTPDAAPIPRTIKVVSPPVTSGNGTSTPRLLVPVTITVDAATPSIRIHASPPGEVHQAFVRVGQRRFLLKTDAGGAYTVPPPVMDILSSTPFTITADFGSTTASVKGILERRVAESTSTRLAQKILPALNTLFRLVSGRNPTTSEWHVWARRILAGEKPSIPELFGALQWRARFQNTF